MIAALDERRRRRRERQGGWCGRRRERRRQPAGWLTGVILDRVDGQAGERRRAPVRDPNRSGCGARAAVCSQSDARHVEDNERRRRRRHRELRGRGRREARRGKSERARAGAAGNRQAGEGRHTTDCGNRCRAAERAAAGSDRGGDGRGG